MAKPAGGVTAGSYYYDVTPAGSEDPQYQYLLYFVPWQPPHMCDVSTGHRLMKSEYRRQVLVVDADQNLHEDVWIGEQSRTFDLTAAGQIATATWQSVQTQGDYPDNDKPFHQYPTGQDNEKPRWVELECKMYSETDDGDDTVYHHASHIIATPDSTTFDGDGMAYIDRTGATDIMHAPDYSANSYQVMRACCDSYEAFLLSCRPTFCCLSLGDENA